MAFDFFQRLPFVGGAATHKIVLNTTDAEGYAAEQQLQELLNDLPEMLAAALINVESGRALASYATAREQNLNKAAAHHAALVKQAWDTLRVLHLDGEHIEDILVTLGSQWHLLRLLPGGGRLLYLVVDSRDTNLALARAVMEACAK
jgi:hypothetical protein